MIHSQIAEHNHLNDSNKPKRVGIRVIFQHVGEIDTLREKYQARGLFEARWILPLNDILAVLSTDDQNSLTDGHSVSLNKTQHKFWDPQLLIENALDDLKEKIQHSAQKISNDEVCVYERRELRGSFWEKLELQHFPFDTQELTISVGSMLFDDKVLLVPDPYYFSMVNREAFVDQQEWILYEHVNTRQRFVQEFLRCEADDDEPTGKSNRERQRCVVDVSCYVARRAMYYFWCGFFLMFMVTLCGFLLFGTPPNQPYFRLQPSVLLVLTTVTFRLVMNRSLPTLSYLTTLDIYNLTSMFCLIVLCMWHGFIASMIYISGHFQKITPTQRSVWVDRIGFLTSFSVYICINIFMIVWVFKVPFVLRRHMKAKSTVYNENLREKMEENRSKKHLYAVLLNTHNDPNRPTAKTIELF